MLQGNHLIWTQKPSHAVLEPPNSALHPSEELRFLIESGVFSTFFSRGSVACGLHVCMEAQTVENSAKVKLLDQNRQVEIRPLRHVATTCGTWHPRAARAITASAAHAVLLRIR